MCSMFQARLPRVRRDRAGGRTSGRRAGNAKVVNTALGAAATYAVMFALLLTLPVAAATTWMALTKDAGYLVAALVSLTLMYGLWRSWRHLADL